MALATFSPKALLDQLNFTYPGTGTIGYLTLLSGDLTTGLGYTANATTNQLTTATAHGLVAGSRVQLVDGVLPTPLLANTDYYAIVSSPTVIRLAATLANAQSAVEIDLTDTGSGALTLAEQLLNATDPLNVLTNKEIVHPSWVARAVIINLGAATIVSGAAQKPAYPIAIDNQSAINLQYQHTLIILSAAAGALRSVPSGVGHIFASEGTVQTVAPASTRSLVTRLRVRNP